MILVVVQFLNNSKPLYASPSGSWRNTGTASAHQYSLAKVQNINEKRRKKLGKCLAILKKISIFAADNAYKAIRGWHERQKGNCT